MKVKELIEQLEGLNPTYDVVVRGYEGGVNDVVYIEACYIERDVNGAWYYGKHVRVVGDELSAVPAYELMGG